MQKGEEKDKKKENVRPLGSTADSSKDGFENIDNKDVSDLTEYSEELSNLEEAVRIHDKRERVEYAVLGLLGIVGLFAAAAVAPNAVGILSKAVPDARPASQRQSIKRAIGRLIKKGYVRKEGLRYCLTREGKARLRTLECTTQVTRFTNTTPPKWDGKWRIVIFDIKEAQRKKRDELRKILLDTGFVKVQDSVWAYPYRCDEVIALLKFHLTLGWDMVYIIADAIEGDEDLRKHFNLTGA